MADATVCCRFEMEVHLVHQSRENKTAVLGIMYKRGRPDTFLSEVSSPPFTHKL